MGAAAPLHSGGKADSTSLSRTSPTLNAIGRAGCGCHIIVSVTPAGVDVTRIPPQFMKQGYRCEVEIEGIGILRNEVEDE